MNQIAEAVSGCADKIFTGLTLIENRDPDKIAIHLTRNIEMGKRQPVHYFEWQTALSSSLPSLTLHTKGNRIWVECCYLHLSTQVFVVLSATMMLMTAPFMLLMAQPQLSCNSFQNLHH